MKTAQFTKPLTIALASGVYEEIRQITEDQQISMAQLVRDAIKLALDRINEEKMT